jgi:hypothetical protein
MCSRPTARPPARFLVAALCSSALAFRVCERRMRKSCGAIYPRATLSDWFFFYPPLPLNRNGCRGPHPDRHEPEVLYRASRYRSWVGTGFLCAYRRAGRGLTTSPSSFTKGPISERGRMSSTVSDGRQSLTPIGVTTIGRLMRIGWAIMKSSN